MVVTSSGKPVEVLNEVWVAIRVAGRRFDSVFGHVFYEKNSGAFLAH